MTSLASGLLERGVHYARLTRLNRPIGNFLLLWPMLWALWLAAGGPPRPDVLAVFVAGVIVMRAAGCVINDFADRNVDGHVKRTRERPMATGHVSEREALTLFVLLCLAAFGLVLLMNRLTILLSLVGVVLAAVALAVGGWTYYQSLQGNLSRDLAAYRPKPARGNGADVDRSAGAAGKADLHSDAGAAATSADSGGSGHTQSTPVNSEEPAKPDASGATAQSGAAPAPASARNHSGASPTADSGESASAKSKPTAKPKPKPTAKKAVASRSERAPTAADEARKTPTSKSTASAQSDTVARKRQAKPMVQATTGPSPLAEALQAGYRALRDGRLADAETAYGRARSIAPDNRDALLGAAAVARRRGDRATARTLYARILQDHPRDPYARAGMTQINGAENPRRSETELKVLLHDHPDSAPLHFALGNVYAAESNWSDAQQAYFDAVRADSDNADYTYNLAVALDHLGETQAARRFYRKALALAGRHPGGFRPAAVRRRLEQLQ